MVDENGRRSIPMDNESVSNNQTYAQSASEVGKVAIDKMAPASTGWILAAVVLMLGLTAMILGTNYMSSAARSKSISEFFVMVESNRAEENRRLQEQNETLANALSRQADRIGRQAVEGSRNRELQDVVEGFQPKGE